MNKGQIVESNRILYTPSTFARESLIHIQEVGSLQSLIPHVSTRERLQSYLFFVVKKGSGTVVYDGVTYMLEKGDCVFLDCSYMYSQCSSQDLWELQWVHFYGNNMPEIYEKYCSRGGKPCFQPKHVEGYGLLLDEIFTIASADSYIKDMKLFEKLTTLLTYLMEDSWSVETLKEEGEIQVFDVATVKAYIENNYQKQTSLDELSQMFYINKYYLLRLFKRQYGVSINQYNKQLRITKSKELLRFTDMSIEEVASSCGIEDRNYFARMFKQVEGTTPREFRDMWKSNKV
ncbi:MAG: AraC family transcriptional regulator [Lachnospiraceae bacterium]